MGLSISSTADVVIVGGGIIGCALAYHLPRAGIQDVVLIERKKLTSGTTWHAAGAVGRLRPTRSGAELAKYAIDLLRCIEDETGQSTGFKQNGAYSVAVTRERLEVLRRSFTNATNLQIPVELISPEQLQERWPLLNIEGITGALHIPENGQVNPIDYTMALAIGAKQAGVRIFEDTAVTKLVKRGDRIIGVETEAGFIEAKTVVLACGMWTRELARSVGVSVPLQAAEHFYFVTEPIPELTAATPSLVIPDECSYWKEDAGKLLVGFFEVRGKAYAADGIPKTFEFDSLPVDLDQYADEMALAALRVPRLETTGVQTFFSGPESFTHDGRPFVGPAPEVGGLFISAGYNSHGIMSAAGMGKVVADWLANGNPAADMHEYALTRAKPFQATRRFMIERVTESIGLWSNMPWPGKQFSTARNICRLPLHHELTTAGAFFGNSGGWEVPLWYDRSRSTIEYKLGRPDWFSHIEAESLAIRDAAALTDQSAYGKFRVHGRDALLLLQHVSANNMDVPLGKVVYTAWLNERGGFEADLTVTRVGDEDFLIVTGGSHARSDFHWLKKFVEPEMRVSIEDTTSSLALLSINGPESRNLISLLTHEDVSDAALPFGHSREIELGCVTARVSRVTYVGELGYEIMIPVEFAGYLYEQILGAGAGCDMRHAGLYTIASCRLERGYRLMGADLDAHQTPFEAGLGFAVDLSPHRQFVGRAAIEGRKGRPPIDRLVQFAIDRPEAPVMQGNEVIWRNGERVGLVTSGAWGFRIQRSLAMGYVSNKDGVSPKWIDEGNFEVEISAVKYPVVAQLASFYDPKGLRTRG